MFEDPEVSLPAGRDLWIFAYGSLMWDPGFEPVARHGAVLRGYRRALCILSIRNRGTRDKPGLALGLCRGGSCRGLAFCIAARDVAATCRTLWAREMPTRAYIPKLLPARLDDNSRVTALTFVARPGHPQVVGDLPLEHAAELVVQGKGLYGTSLDYLREVIQHLDCFRIADSPLHRIHQLAEAKQAGRDAVETKAR
jgi:cation transport protein ChaC